MPTSDLRAVVTAEGVQQASAQLATFGKQIDTIGVQGTAQVSKFGVAAKAAFTALGVAAVEGIKKAIDQTQQLGSETRSLSRTLGVGAEEASRFGGIAKLLGVNVDSLNRNFGIFSKHLVDGGAAFEKYGISLENADGTQKSFNQLIGEAADKYNDLAPGVERTAFVLDVFGRSGRDLVPILAKGSDGLEEFGDQAERLGLVMTEKDLGVTKELALATRELAAAWQGAQKVVGLALAPVLAALAEAITPLLAAFNAMPGPLRTIAAVTLVVGVSFAKWVTAAGILGNMLPWFGAKLGIASLAMGSQAVATAAASEALVLYTANARGAITATTTLGAASATSSVGMLGMLKALGPPALIASMGILAAVTFTAAQEAKDHAANVAHFTEILQSHKQSLDQVKASIDAQDIPGWAKAAFVAQAAEAAGNVDDMAANVDDLTDALDSANPKMQGFLTLTQGIAVWGSTAAESVAAMNKNFRRIANPHRVGFITGGTETNAQHGFHGTVTGPHRFFIEPGVRERVDIGPVTSKSAGGGGSISLTFINRGTLVGPDGKQWVLDTMAEGLAKAMRR
jgi:hypothetical protein